MTTSESIGSYSSVMHQVTKVRGKILAATLRTAVAGFVKDGEKQGLITAEGGRSMKVETEKL